MTFNLGGAYDPTDPGPHGWAARRELAAGVVRRHAPDVVAFQEFDDLHIGWTESALPDYSCLPGLPGDTVERPTFNALCWRRDRWRLHGHGGWNLNEQQRRWERGWDAANIRTANWAHLEERTTGRAVLLVNTHLDHVGQTSRMESVALLTRLIDEQNRTALPVALAGDFNTRHRRLAQGRPGEALTADPLLEQILAAGFEDAFAVTGAHDDATSATYHAYEGKERVPEQDGATDRLDWILVRGLEVTSYQRVTDADPPVYPSDHWPVVADLAFDR